MNDNKVFCPQCQNQVVFIRSAFINTCPACGARFSRSDGRLVDDVPGAATAVMGILRVLMWVVVVMVAVAGVGVAVLFVGCAVAMGGF